MNLPSQIAKHLRDVHFGGNWTSVNLKDTLKDVTWQQATTKLHFFNTIAALVFHINYYISAVSKVLQGEPLNAKDKYSFDVPPIQTQEDWENLLNKTWADAENFALLIEQLPEAKMQETFIEEKYGNYYRNLTGIIEHCHYHLGQICIEPESRVEKSGCKNLCQIHLQVQSSDFHAKIKKEYCQRRF